MKRSAIVGPGCPHGAAEDTDVGVGEDRVDGGDVDGEDCLGLRGDELSPGGPGASRGGIEAGVLEDRPDGGRGDPMAEATSSPWMRRYPHPGFSRAIRSTSTRNSGNVGWAAGSSSRI